MGRMDAASIDLIVTDPPYGHNNNNNGDLIARREQALGRGDAGKPRPIANDGQEANELFVSFLHEANRLLKPGACCCCCGGGGGPDPQFARWSLWLDEIIGFKQMVVWDKGPMGMGWHYRRSYETVLVGQKPGAPCKWYDATNRIENVIRPGSHGVRKIIPSPAQHPTEKPIDLAMLFIKLHSKPGDVVLDPFMGGGWAGIASMMSGRRFIGIECDAQWYDMAKDRIAEADAEGVHGRMFAEMQPSGTQELLKV